MEQSLQTNDQDRQECPLTDIVKLDAPLNELLQKVASTAEILVYKQQNININAQWKDWALEMLMAGYETENLFILAGEDIHCNPIEFAELTDKIFEELHLNEIDSNSIIILYSLFIVKSVIQSPNKNKVSVALNKLEQECINNEYNTFLYDFYLLSNAIDELKALGEQWYWNDASLTKENWYEYTLKFFKLWIENPDPKYKILRENNCNASLPKKKNIFSRFISYIRRK